jgi:hypothetical protein
VFTAFKSQTSWKGECAYPRCSLFSLFTEGQLSHYVLVLALFYWGSSLEWS